MQNPMVYRLPSSDNIILSLHSFSELDTNTLFDVLKLRTDVFVVEQQCAYPELDELDRATNTLHLTAYAEQQLAGCARMMNQQPGLATIGRVATAERLRSRGIARKMMVYLMEQASVRIPELKAIELSAQVQVQSFYESLGFEATTETFLEDGIEHVGMRKTIHPGLQSDR